ncbi:MAG: type II and III secretion system protein family protein [Acidobacteria bacterium]|nr:type II and III secretion system protein family protein [Acidobacteriota bacterium]
MSFAQARDRTTEITLYVNQSSVIQFDQPLSRVSIAQPAMADATIISPTQLLLIGKAVGSSSLIAWSTVAPEQPVTFIVRVVAEIEPIVKQITTLFPSEQIRVEQVDGRVILSGTVSSQRIIEAALPLFEGTGLKPVNLTQVASLGAPAQVMLQVRVAEVNRRVLRDIGATYSWWDPRNPRGQNEAAVGPNQFNAPQARFANSPLGPDFTFSDVVNLFIFNPATSLGAFVRALHQRNAFRSLAEPNIIAVNGQEASFLAGGEFPYPVVQPTSSGFASISIVFREFGVRLGFTPTIVEGNRIRLKLAPEVSALDFVNALQFSGFRVPALITRKASTTVELQDGQSFALAGLLSNDMTRVDSKIPLLGDIPVLGYLFRSQSYIKNETELVFLCTARLVNPVGVEELPPIPGQQEWKQEGFQGPFGHRTPVTDQPTPKPEKKK